MTRIRARQIGGLTVAASPEGISTVYEANGREFVAISVRTNPDRIGQLGDEMYQDSAAGGPMQVAPPISDKTQGYYVFTLSEE